MKVEKSVPAGDIDRKLRNAGVKRGTSKSMVGTYMVGRLSILGSQLEKVLGPPSDERDYTKSTAEWDFELLETGEPFGIYDYHTGDMAFEPKPDEWKRTRTFYIGAKPEYAGKLKGALEKLGLKPRLEEVQARE